MSKKMIRFGIILMLVCLVASSVLAITYKITYPKIVAQREKEERDSLKIVLSDADEFNKKEGKEYYIAYKDKNIIGYIMKITAQGYSAPIEMLVGLNLKGTILGITILDQKETPGLGAKISEIKYGEKEPWFLRQFRGKKTADLIFPNINAITGATISSRAVLEAIKREVNKFLATINN